MERTSSTAALRRCESGSKVQSGWAEVRLTVSKHLEHRENCDRLHHAGKVSPPYHLGSITGLAVHAPDAATLLLTHSTDWSALCFPALTDKSLSLDTRMKPDVALLFLVSGKKAEGRARARGQ